MEEHMELMEPFSFAKWPMILFAVIFFTGLLIYVVIFIINKLKKRVVAEVPVIIERKPETVEKIKRKYMAELSKIENEFANNRLSLRQVYQKMSICIRKFVYEVTGVKVQNYTLHDIKKLNMPMLEQLISEYYAPEFAKRANVNVAESLQKTKRVIEAWK